MNKVKQYGKVAITFEGEFNQNKSYERLCIVEYAGMSFLSKVDGTTSIPTQNKNEWIQLSVPGPRGLSGEKGNKGDKGDKGEHGAKGISTRTIFVYKHSETVPEKPVGGYVDFIGGAIRFPEGWQPSDNIPSPVWRSERTFFEDNSIQDDWTVPMKITGDNGKNGVDGVNMEFIYKVTKRPTIVPDISNMPSENVNDYVPVEFGWSDRPNGVSPADRIEWVCTRKKVNGVWSNWEGPTIWSAYGEKGQDGDGVEYIFYIDNTGNAPSNPTPSDWEYNDEYQNPDKEYVPTELGWTDVATGISENKRFEWQCSRKFRNGFWQPFEGPYLWSKYGDKGTIGDKIIEMYAVTDDHEAPIVNKNNINPGSIWSIAPPETFDPSTGGAIWKIYTYVDYKNEFVEWQTIENDETAKHIGWSDPIIQTGYNGKDGISPNWRTYIYKQSDEKPELPTFTDPTKFEEAGWKDAPYNDVDGDGSIDIKGRWWECSGLVNGESGEVEWQYIREINGSNSKALFQVTTSRVQPECNKTNNNPGNLWKETYDIPNIYQYVWMITAQFDTQGNIVGEWQGPTCITGETPKIEENGDVTIGGEPTNVNILNLHLELDNDSETIPTNSEGNAIGTVSAITTAQLYNGSKLITEGVTYSAVATKCTLKETENTTGIFEVTALNSGTDVTGYYVEITAIYKNIGISKKFNISKNLGDTIYKIKLSKNVINRKEINKFTVIKVYKLDNEFKHLTSLPSNLKLKIVYTSTLTGDTNEAIVNSFYNKYGGEYSYRLSDYDTEPYVELLLDDVIVDSETIGVVDNGNSIKIKGSLNSVDELPDIPIDESDCYIIGLDIYCWDSTKEEWFNAGQFKGVDGKAPIISDDGYWMFWNGNEYEKTEYYAKGDGRLPYIGTNGNWFEWDETTQSYKDTGFAAKGENGITPTIGEDGYWYFNGVKSEYSAIGDDGHSPYIKDGYWWEWNVDVNDYVNTNIRAEGVDGETFYLHIAYCDKPTDTSDNSDFVLQSSQGVVDKLYRGEYTSNLKTPSTNKLYYKWTKYRGEDGKKGIAGIPGVSLYLRYQLGTVDAPINDTLPNESDGDSDYWTKEIPEITEEHPYIWCTQGEKVYISQENYYYSWSAPFRLSGINGLNGVGDKGDPGKIIYPAGIYTNNLEYKATEKKAPYVWDPNYGAYYVYLSTTPWKGSDQNNLTPGEEYAANSGSGTNQWELFEQFEAVYAKIGIIANGLIGSAVFNGDYMFSQQGYTTLTGSVPASGTSYENFNPDDPFGEGNDFYPNICFNFKTGGCWIGRNKFVVDNEGNIKLGKFNITPKGLEYALIIDGDDSLFSINEEGISLKQAGDIIYELNSNGNAKFVNGNILFNKDGTWKLGNQIRYKDKVLNIGNKGFYIQENGNIIDKTAQYIDLFSYEDWPSYAGDRLDFQIQAENVNDFYIYNSGGFSNTHVQTGNYGFNIDIQIAHTHGKYIKVHIADDLNDEYKAYVSFSEFGGSFIYNILATMRVGSGEIQLPTTTEIPYMICECGYTYVFVCEMVNGYKMRYISRY